ncbi:MAG: glycosyltransferase family 39 protein [Candidatus Omnitrophica bacterium]|nr:glycosyltransferase family 39 protein [Candidatus Omnitrophota bacterium]
MNTSARKSSSADPAMTVWLWIMIGFMGYRLVLYALYAVDHITYPFDYDAGEGLILSRAWIMARGGDIYSPVTVEPYFVMNYPPVFEGLVAVVARLFGPGHWIGRLLSVTAAGVCAFCVSRIVRQHSGKSLSAVAAGLLLYASCWLTSWSVISRVDTFGLMCTLAGLAVMSRDASRRTVRTVLAGAVLFSLALFTRQSLIAAPLACALAYLFPNDNEPQRRRHKIVFLGAMIVIPAVLLAVMQLVTCGEFYRHTVLYTMGEFEVAHFTRWIGDYLNMHGATVVLCAGYAFMRRREPRLRVPLLFWVLSLAVSFTAGKEGASINYFLEFWAASCILIGLMLGELEHFRGSGWRRLAGPVIVGILFVQVLVMHYRTDFNHVREVYRQSSARLSAYVRDSPGEVLSEYTGYLVINGKQPVYQPFSMTQLAERGLWDEEKFIADIERGRFSLIVMTNVGMGYGRWSQRMIDAVKSHYDLIDTLPCYELSFYESSVNVNNVYRRKQIAGKR